MLLKEKIIMQEHEVAELDLAFKGDREYLHGTDIFNELVMLMSPVEHIKFQLKKIMTSQISIIRLGDRQESRQKISGIFKFMHKKNEIELGLFENSKKINRRYEYNEEEVIRDVIYTKDKAELHSSTKYSFIERLVSLNKSMLVRFVEQPSVKWYFTQIDITRLPADDCSLSLSIKQQLGIRLVLSNIVANGVKIGSIGFSGVVEE